MLPPPDHVEYGEATRVAGDRLAVENARFRRQSLDSGHNERIAIAEIVAVASNQPNAIAVAVSDDAKAVVLDFVNPAPARWRLLCREKASRVRSGIFPQ